VNITSKSRYALKIMMDLAHYSPLPSPLPGPLPGLLATTLENGSATAKTPGSAIIRRNDIARRQGIPTEYLDQIMMRLRGANLVDSVRGRAGGYRLGRSAESITLWDVFASVEDSIFPVECVAHGDRCGFENSCITRGPWTEIFESMRAPLIKMTLADATFRWADEHRMCPAGGIRECRGG
jgi:Rrf2 family protein